MGCLSGRGGTIWRPWLSGAPEALWAIRDRWVEPVPEAPNGLERPPGASKLLPDPVDQDLQVVVFAGVRVLVDEAEFDWRLGIYSDAVLNRALAAVDGLSSALDAAAALRDLAHREVAGKWPGLADAAGELPDGVPPADEGWVNPWREAVPDNLGGPDLRGQCYDFAAVLSAFSRSIGIPSTLVTAINPGQMPYPYQVERGVIWEFHVWTEIFAGGQWWAADAAWFTTLASGNGFRISGEFGGIRMDLTEAYRTGEADPEDG